jgi:hypothetical protein
MLVLLFLAGGCAKLHDVVLPTYQPPPTYDELYPLYIELCAVSQIRAKFAKEGGSPGHAVMWLKGVCLDEDATYPKLRLCDPGEVDLADPENGTGISVNKVLKNANWLLVPGRSLFFHGNLTPDTVLDKSPPSRMPTAGESLSWSMLTKSTYLPRKTGTRRSSSWQRRRSAPTLPSPSEGASSAHAFP